MTATGNGPNGPGGRTPGGTATPAGGAAPAGPATAPGSASTAYVPPGSAPSGTGDSALDRLNSRLNGMLPGGDPVSYSNKHYENDLGAAVEHAEQEYYKAAAPPASVLAKAIEIVRQRGTLLGAPTLLYIIKRQRIFGFDICTGWQIVQTVSGPQGGYTVGACSGEKVVPSGGLPTLPPKAPPH